VADWIWTNADKLGALAEGLTALVAVAALLAAVLQIKASRSQQKEATAYGVYSEQLKLDLQISEFSHPDLDVIRKAGRLQQDDDFAPGWRHAVRYGVTPHAEHIREHVLQFASSYGEELVALMRDVASQRVTAAP